MATLTMTQTTTTRRLPRHRPDDFWAAWCGPAASRPGLRAGLGTSSDGVRQGDTEVEAGLSASYGVTSIPTLVAYRDGIPLFSQAGAVPERALEDLLQRIRDLDMEQVRASYDRQRAAKG